MSAAWDAVLSAVQQTDTWAPVGRVTGCVGLVIQARGPKVAVGSTCTLAPGPGEPGITAEVVGFRDHSVLLMPLGDPDGVAPGWEVRPAGGRLQVGVGPGLLGRVLDGLGNPADGLGPLATEASYPVFNRPPDPMTRPPIRQPLAAGVRALDGLLTVGRGQRIGLFAGSGVGKSTLLGMIARGTAADCSVIALVGERGREVREFLETDLGPEGLAHSVVVVATSDQPALVRIKAALTATAIAEYLRDQGKDVLLLMDSVTRLAQAQREVGLAAGETPAARGYTPSVFTLLPRLLERSGASPVGSITGFYTVLVDGDDMNEPIADTVRGILDGHVVLSRSLAERGHFPAIDVLQSISRVMPAVTSPEQQQLAYRFRTLLATYRDAEDLVNIGAYRPGANLDLDEAVGKLPQLHEFLRQGVQERTGMDDTLQWLSRLVATH